MVCVYMIYILYYTLFLTQQLGHGKVIAHGAGRFTGTALLPPIRCQLLILFAQSDLTLPDLARGKQMLASGHGREQAAECSTEGQDPAAPGSSVSILAGSELLHAPDVEVVRRFGLRMLSDQARQPESHCQASCLFRRSADAMWER